MLTAGNLRTEADLTLVERLRRGDATALEGLMDRYASRVNRLAHAITHNAADAEEVVQDVFLTLFCRIHTFEGRASLGSWIYRVTTNAALIKRRGKRAGIELSLDTQFPTFLPDGDWAGDPAHHCTDWSQTPETELLSRETRDILIRVIGGLPDQYRAVLILRDVEGLSNEEVAEVVGETIPAVKSRLHRARLVLREELTRYLGPRQWLRGQGSRPAGGRASRPYDRSEVPDLP
ncbi:MAG TPA: sigma-70 family RNA polymerase sigma factor [Candidatus Acidoferrum sp.]|nr:sigma-70 family RNA polymerase sigma factor [Candidatus Acidoferrum sp.]